MKKRIIYGIIALCLMAAFIRLPVQGAQMPGTAEEEEVLPDEREENFSDGAAVTQEQLRELEEKNLTIADPIRDGAAYNGELPVMPSDETETAYKKQSTYIPVVNGFLDYDAENDRFVNYIGGEASEFFYSNVPMNMVTADPVSIKFPEERQYILYKDNTKLDSPQMEEISEPGGYILEIYRQGVSAPERYQFRILPPVTNLMNTFVPPAGFAVTEVTLNQEPIEFTDNSNIECKEDGAYRVTFQNNEIGKIFQTAFALDRVAPELLLPEVVNGVSSGKVSLSDYNNTDLLDITLDGEPYEMSFLKTLTESGSYHIRITDEAGNDTEYDFVIKVYFTISSYVFIALIILLVIGIIIYGRYIRKHVRIR